MIMAASNGLGGLDINKFNARMMPTVWVVYKDFPESSRKAFSLYLFI